MKNIMIAAIIFVFAVSAGLAQDIPSECGGCLKFPYTPDPPCKKICTENLVTSYLKTISTEELRYFFSLDKESAQKVVAINGRVATPSIEMYSKELTEVQGAILKLKFDSLSENQIKYLQTPETNKEKISLRKDLTEFFKVIDQSKIKIDGGIVFTANQNLPKTPPGD